MIVPCLMHVARHTVAYFPVIVFVLAMTGASSAQLRAEFPKFEAKVIDPNVGQICYAVTTTDVDGDGKPDIVAVTENRVVWYQNPDWKPRVVIENQTEKDNVCIAAHDIDGDGRVDFALGAGWLNGKNLGTLQWLSRGASLDDKWRVHFIGTESWTHRIKWGDFLGTGKPQLIVSPLNKTVAPSGVRVLAFEVPADPAKDAWKPTVLDETMNAMHAHWTGDFDGDGKSDVITAAQEGVFLFRRGTDSAFVKTRLGDGASDPKEAKNRGAGEIKVGRLKGNRRFIATVEPMHGHSVAVYTEPKTADSPWTRHVLDDTLKWGHAVGVGDFDGDGSDEVVIGQRDKGTGPVAGPGVYIYDIDDLEATGKLTKHVIENGGVACEDLVVGDWNGDGRPDIVAGGRATHNVKMYVNLGSK